MEPSFSPDRTVRVDWSIEQGRMSHEIHMPSVVWAATGERILDMGWDWDGHLEWLGSSNAFSMHYRRYARGGCVSVWVFPERGLFRLGNVEGKAEPLATLASRLEEEIERSIPPGMAQPAPPVPPSRRATLAMIGWVGLVFLLIGFGVWKLGIQRQQFQRTATPPPLLQQIPTPKPYDFEKNLREIR